MNEFRVISFEVGSILGGPLNVEFFSNSDKIDTNSFGCSLLIGENGTGKSQCLYMLVSIFRHLQVVKGSGKFVRFPHSDKYKISYILDGNIYIITQEGSSGTVEDKYGGIEISEIKLPSKIVVQSFSVSDKFTHGEKSEDDYYTYLGIRTTSNAIYTSQIEKDIVESIVKGITNDGFIDFLSDTLNFLEYDKNIEIVFQVKNKKQFRNVTQKNDFIEQYEKFATSNRRVNNKLKKYSPSYAFEKVNDILNNYQAKDNSSSNKTNLNEKRDFSSLRTFYEFLDLLSSMQILENAKVKFAKASSDFKFEYASSGEKQILYTLLTINTYIQANSLVLIDEPEISLHPNWQMKYIKLLEESFNKYNNCHFIIATHSHFLVSDLRKNISSVVAMKRIKKNIVAELYTSSTYGWSAEDILYNVFGVATTRNYYLANDVEKIVQAIIKKQLNDEVKEKVAELNRLLPHLKNTDPLKHIIEKIIKRV